MPAYTICNSSRDISKLVVGGSLEEIKMAGDKFGCKAKQLVLEENGAEIEDEEVLAVLSLKDKIMILGEAEEWCKEDVVPSCAGSTDDCAENPTLKDLDVPVLQVPTLSPSSNTRITPRTPLPKFSDYVQMKLINKESHLVWSQCIREAAYYYLVQYPNIGKSNQSEYQTIGGSMYGQYPLIRRDGPRPWSAFAKDLSSRLRHVRWSENRKSLLPNSETIGDFNPSPAKSLCLAQDTRSPSSKLRKIPEEELEQHLLKLGKLSEDIEQKHLKDERLLRVAKDINILLKETYVNRREWIEAQRESGSVKQITDRYPCFTNPIFVFAELKLIKGKDLWTSAQKNIDCLFDITRSLHKGDGKEGLEADISSFLCMEKESAYDRGKGRKTASILTVHRVSHEDFSPDEVDKAVQKVSNEHSPSLMVFVNDDAITHAIVKADNVNLSSWPTFRKSVLHLLAVYYIAWISYPRQYSQILGLLQQLVLGEVFTEQKSKKHLQFAHILTNLWPVEQKF